MLADYVPFYFAPRSPMLYAIYKCNVQDYTGSQEEIVYLVSTVEIATGLGLPGASPTDMHTLPIQNFLTTWTTWEK